MADTPIVAQATVNCSFSQRARLESQGGKSPD